MSKLGVLGFEFGQKTLSASFETNKWCEALALGGQKCQKSPKLSSVYYKHLRSKINILLIRVKQNRSLPP